MHYYKRNIGDYAKKAGRLSLLQHGVYNLLLDACYDRERFPTRDEAIEWVWAESDEEIAAVDLVLKRFFKEESGLFVQDRVSEELEEYRKLAEKNKENGKLGGRPKKTQTVTTGNPLESDTNPKQSESNPNQEPLTTNHKPLTNTTDTCENSNEIPRDVDPVPYLKIVELFHSSLPELPTIAKLTSSRKSHVRSRWKNELPSLEAWERYFCIVKDSAFLMGRAPPGFGRSKPFQADFDFLIKESNVIKIVEGKYCG